ncbi:hypothetical protein GOBAR_AA24029 [Gossypium barbadense]|uniref:40S ribosomal protein S8 n=1 Tax=Gossypium barbadense TaxID=3634 RepID=A0A2P5WZY0_GOSBA|nr:hypothetical protein GOBAR_AA24029 [Gossypium barbadense]
MGISRDSMHKRRATGGKKKAWRKKRKYELGRQPANTKLSSNKTVRRIRVRGGNVKWRALRLDTGNYSWGSEANLNTKIRLKKGHFERLNLHYHRHTCDRQSDRLLHLVLEYQFLQLVTILCSFCGENKLTGITFSLGFPAATESDVGVDGLPPGALSDDAAPFKQWYLQHYGVDIGRKKKTAAKKEGEEGETGTEEVKKSNHVLRKLEKRQQNRKLDPHIEDQFASGRLLACISSRPGQCGRADGYILEGKELEFYMKKIQRKKGKGAA